MAVFLMENGVLSMGNKTPVTILQEMLQRKGINPHYDLLYNGVGTMDPIFKYQVSAVGLSAIGDGKSKKEAKHDAAAALLKKMQKDTGSFEIQDVDIASPYSGSIKENFVGMLDDICFNNKIPFPTFIPISEKGPPHARVFTMQCQISCCKETAVARTKKQAKHLVAQQMINRIAKIMGDKFIPLSEKTTEFEDLHPISKTIESGMYRHDFSIPIGDLHNMFFHKMEEFPLPKDFLDLYLKPDEFFENLGNPRESLEKLVKEIEGVIKTYCPTKETLIGAFQETEKDCERFSLDELESDDDFDERNCSNEANIMEGGNYLLEELVLGEHTCNSSPTDNKLTDEKSVLSQDKDIGKLLNKFKNKFRIESPLKTPVFLFLSVECPQGSWMFEGLGDTTEEAEQMASFKALQFVCIMSVCSNNKIIENGNQS